MAKTITVRLTLVDGRTVTFPIETYRHKIELGVQDFDDWAEEFGKRYDCVVKPNVKAIEILEIHSPYRNPKARAGQLRRWNDPHNA